MKKSNFQFSKPYLNELIFTENKQFDTSTDLEKIKLHNKFSVEVKKDSKDSMALVTLTLETNQDEDDAPFKIKAAISSFFRWSEVPDERINLMLRINAPALLLSYLRPIVAQITNSSRFPVYNIPFFNFLDEQSSDEV